MHDLGIDDEGRPYFTMRLLDGLRLDEVFKLARTGAGGWSLARVLEVLIKVCDTMAFAHAHGVVHRDLKPANVMVGEYGEAYVLDWGLARVLAGDGDEANSAAGAPDTAVDTGHGDVVGTPAYMPQEQAAGEHDQLGPAADVYALGAMLYELLAGRIPYEEPGTILSGKAALKRVIEGPPRPLGEVTEHAPPELIAVCEKAMSREPEQRYPDGSALAEDLRAFVMGRVVHAHTSGPWAELFSWVRRNRATAGMLGGAAVAVLALALTLVQVRANRRAEFGRLASPALLDRLERRADELWPAWPGQEPALAGLLEEVRGIATRADEFRAERDRLASLGRPVADDAPLAERIDADDLRRARSPARARRCDRGRPERSAAPGGDRGGGREGRGADETVLPPALPLIEFEDDLVRAEHSLLHETVNRLDVYARGDRHTSLVRSLEARLDWSRTVTAHSIDQPAAAWARARAQVLADPRFGGLELEPQLGLLPLGADPDSGLQEFAHLGSGAPARRGQGGWLELEEDAGIVFVLVPGGEVTPPADPDSPEDPQPVELAAYLLAKHELTQAQWEHLTGEHPSTRQIGTLLKDGHEVTPRFPVENVSWSAADQALRRQGLTLPSQLQWQHAARAGTTGERWTGEEWSTLAGQENLSDMDLDAWATTCPVDALAPNPWGFFHVLGNVSEWCDDILLKSAWWPYEAGTGRRRAPMVHGDRISCGGHWNVDDLHRVRSDARGATPEGRALGIRGLRAARLLR